jgi:hypothetical protein
MGGSFAQLRLIATAHALFLVVRKKGFVSWPNLDLQNLMLLGFADLVHLIDVAVGELL